MGSIAVTICTRQRPKMLTRCLTSVLHEISDGQSDDVLIVIENHETPDSETIVLKLADEFPNARTIYHHEPKLGIPIARNRALDIAVSEGVDWIGFIDDDEEVSEGWLRTMRKAADDLAAEALTGPVMPIYPHELPSWMKPKAIKLYAHGEALDGAATNNTLVDLNWLRRQNPSIRFDERLRFTGGSDTEFFYRFLERGGTIKWVSDAIVTETVPTSRLTMNWQIERLARTQANNIRHYRQVNGFARASWRYLPAAIRRIFLRGLPRCLAAVPLVLFSPERAIHAWYDGRRTIGNGIGILRGLFGHELQPYRKIDGE